MNYLIDNKTTNVSFTQMTVDLKRLGVNNNLFFLRLYDRSLQGVDPFSPSLSDDMKIRIITECTRNPYYFLRECVRIPMQGGTPIRFELQRANLAMVFLALYGIDNYTTIPRQIGKTVSICCVLAWAYLFGTSHSEIMLLNYNEDKAKDNLEKIMTLIDLLPDYLKMKKMLNEDGKIDEGVDNAKKKKNPVNGNSIIVKASALTKDKAETIGRGSTQPLQYSDETEFTNEISTIIEAAGPAYVTAAANAEKNNALHCRFFSSTPGDLDSKTGISASKILSLTTRWRDKMLDMSKKELKEYVDKNSRNKIVYIEYQYHQLNRSEEWLENMCSALNGDELKIRREIYLERMHGSSLSPFKREDLSIIQEMMEKPIIEIIVNKWYIFNLYEHLDKNRVYFVGVDCANGVGSDSTSVTIYDPYNMRVVGEFKSNTTDPLTTAKILISLIKFNIPLGILMIERNGPGDAIISIIKESPASSRLYFDKKTPQADNLNRQHQKMNFKNMSGSSVQPYGVWTGDTNRQLMMNILFNDISKNKERLNAESLVKEILSLVRNSSSKIVAGSGSHDDCVMSYLILRFVQEYGNNLDLFGYHKEDILEMTNQLSEDDIYREALKLLQNQGIEGFEYFKDSDEPDIPSQTNPIVKYTDDDDDMYKNSEELGNNTLDFSFLNS